MRKKSGRSITRPSAALLPAGPRCARSEGKAVRKPRAPCHIELCFVDAAQIPRQLRDLVEPALALHHETKIAARNRVIHTQARRTGGLGLVAIRRADRVQRYC